MCCFLATSLLKYAYTCVHNVRYICNVIKICLTLMASKYAIFPFYKFQTDDVSARLAKERYFIDVFSPKLNMF